MSNSVSWAAAHILLLSLSHLCVVQGFTVDLGKVCTQNLGLPHSGLVYFLLPSVALVVPVLWFFRLRVTEPGNSASARLSFPMSVLFPNPPAFSCSPFPSSSWFLYFVSSFNCYPQENSASSLPSLPELKTFFFLFNDVFIYYQIN